MGSFNDEVTILGPYRTHTFPVEGVQARSYPVPSLAFRSILGWIAITMRAYFELGRVVDRQVVHATDYLTTAVVSTLQDRVPVVLTTPGNVFERLARGILYVGPLQKEVYKITARISARQCARIVATSSDMAYWWHLTGAPEQRIAVIPTGVDADFFRPVPHAKTQLGFNPTESHLLYVGRLDSECQVEQVLQAHAQLSVMMPTVQLDLVGDGTARERLADLATVLGTRERVTLHGWVQPAALPSFYSAADLVVFPRAWGGTPRAPLEAMACGVPVLAADSPVVQDFIIAGKTGYLARPNDIGDFAAKMAVVLGDRDHARRVGENARAYIEEHLDWGILVSKLRREVYEPLVGLDELVEENSRGTESRAQEAGQSDD